MNYKRSEYALGPGRLYVAKGSVSEGSFITNGVSAGETDGGVTVVHEYRAKEILDVDGNVAAVLRFGEKITVKGKVCRIRDEAVPYLTGDRVSILLRCPLPDGDEFRLFLKGGISGDVTWHITAGGALEFQLTCGGSLTDPEFRMGREIAS